jgi:signal transduction histidine kinase
VEYGLEGEKMESIYRNPEIKKVTIKMLILFLVVYALFMWLNAYQLRRLSRELAKNNHSIAGAFISRHPELEGEIIGYFTKGLSFEDQILGEVTLKKYGYDENIPVSVVPIISSFQNSFRRSSSSVLLTAFTIIFSIIILDYKSILKKIRDISRAAERIVEGDFSYKLPDDREGEFAILGHQFNEMSSRVQRGIELLKKDKIFLKDILSDISHQLKTPLSSLIAFNDLILDGNIYDEEIKKDFLQKSRNQLNRMEWLIINLLKIARLEAGAINFEKKKCSLLLPIERALESLKVKYEEKKQHIIVKEKNNNVLIYQDENWMTEAYTNIVKNCIEHTPEEGEIYIELSETSLFVRVSIKDNGEGISQEDLPHVFQRFYKGKNSLKSDSVGIGLALSKSIIENQQGSITVKSKPGLGTEFEIIFLKNI